MTLRRRTVLATVSIALVAAACGSSADESTDSLGTLADLTALEAALAESSDAEAYRVITAAGQTLTADVFGLDVSTTADIDRPAAVSEVDADGEIEMTMDIAALLGDAAPPDVDAGFVLWQDADEVLIDLRGYEAIAELNPTIRDTPFRPGLARVDLASVRDQGGDELVALIAGQTPPDLAALATALLELDGIAEAAPEDDGRYRLSTRYGDVVAALGQDLSDLARSVSAGVAPAVQMEVDELAELYESVFRDAPAELIVTIDGGVLSEFEVEADLSAVWDRVGELARDLGATDDDVAMLDDAVLITTSITRFEADPAIDVELPDSDGYEDRTDEFITLLGG